MIHSSSLYILTFTFIVSFYRLNCISSYEFVKLMNSRIGSENNNLTHYEFTALHTAKDFKRTELKQNIKSNISGRRIFGGQYVKEYKKYSYMAYVFRNNTVIKDSNIIYTMDSCGSTILNPRFLLTAAHCVRECQCVETIDDDYCPYCLKHDLNDFRVFAGSSVAGKAPQVVSLKEIHIHPEHKYVDLKHNCIHRFDIALLELATPLKFNKYVSSVKLVKPVKNGHNNRFLKKFTDSKKQCLILGWGTETEDDNTPFLEERLKKAKVPIYRMDKCLASLKISRELYVNRKKKSLCTDTDICTRSRHDINGICHGDSGGPLMCGGVQVGIASWGIKGCAGPDTPAMFTRVDVSLPWINTILSLSEK